ncbi:MAG: tetratricopeptide repeat protein [Acidobacteriota bacterium]|jgi:tetratricopeptide (TPR) repeat protein|nr:tetratricopeptide repeat protein [Acidobacteriota bacterium]
MAWLKNLIGALGFRAAACRRLADGQAVAAGVACLGVGVVANALAGGAAASTDGVVRIFLDLAQWLLFLLFVYVPVLVALSNAFSDDGLGLSFSVAEYRAHLAVLSPLWGVVLLATAPLQWLIPRFLSIAQDGAGVVADVHAGYLLRPLLLAAYAFWAVMRLGYLSPVRTCGVFALSLLVLPFALVLVSFVMSLSLLLLIPLVYFAAGWLRNQGVARSGAGDFQRNLKALTVNPQDADAHYQLGVIHLGRGDVSSARDRFAAAVRISPEVAEYQYHLGRACERGGDWREALACYEETYRLDPEYGQGDVFREVGKAYLQTGAVAKGMEFLEFFLARRGADPEGRYWMAAALQKSGDAEGARVQLNRILEQARANPRFFRKQNREWIYRARNLLREM